MKTRLFRANVVPSAPSTHPKERFVFFETDKNPSLHLKKLLTAIWHVETKNWLKLGFIYNVLNEEQLIELGISKDKELRLFEIGWSGNFNNFENNEYIIYANNLEIDFFVSPSTREKLEKVKERIKSC